MKDKLQKILLRWPKRIIRDVDLAAMLTGSDNARYSLVKRAIQNKVLTRIINGVYFIEEPYAKGQFHTFEIAQMLEGSSYVSFESALSYHQLIPEAVYTTSCATTKRTREIRTRIGVLWFKHVPTKNFFLGVERVVDGPFIYLMATPWRALADHYFVFQRPWTEPSSVFEDLRIDEEDLRAFSLEPLRGLVREYPSPRVRRFFKQFLTYMEQQHDQ